MDRDRDPPVETTGKVLTFPFHGAEPEVAAAGVAGLDDARAAARRGRLSAAWIDGAWVLLATILAGYRVWIAVAHRQVFGAEASAAFVLVVSMPLIRARRIVAAVGRAVAALRRRPSPGRGIESGGPDSPPKLPVRRGRPVRRRSKKP